MWDDHGVLRSKRRLLVGAELRNKRTEQPCRDVPKVIQQRSAGLGFEPRSIWPQNPRTNTLYAKDPERFMRVLVREEREVGRAWGDLLLEDGVHA